jgi:hypothetical protein
MASNVELLRTWIEVFNTRDIEALIALVPLCSTFAIAG